jgi:hypothetical protein
MRHAVGRAGHCAHRGAEGIDVAARPLSLRPRIMRPGTTISSGLPLMCTELATSAVGLNLVSSVNVFDVELAGDIAFFFSFDCQ